MTKSVHDTFYQTVKVSTLQDNHLASPYALLAGWIYNMKKCELLVAFMRRILQRIVGPYKRMDDSLVYIKKKFMNDVTTV